MEVQLAMQQKMLTEMRTELALSKEQRAMAESSAGTRSTQVCLCVCVCVQVCAGVCRCAGVQVCLQEGAALGGVALHCHTTATM